MSLPLVSIELGKDAESQATLALIGRFGSVVLVGATKGLRLGMKHAEGVAVRGMRGNRIRPRSGSLIKHVRGVVRTDKDGFPIGALGVAKGLADKYAAAQELGTVGKGGALPDIKPVKGRALAVPLPAALDRQGVPKFTGPLDPKLRNQLFIIERPGKPPLLARKQVGKGGTKRHKGGGYTGKLRIEPLFVLVRRVALRPRHYLRDALLEAQPEILRQVGAEVTKAIDAKAKGGGA